MDRRRRSTPKRKVCCIGCSCHVSLYFYLSLSLSQSIYLSIYLSLSLSLSLCLSLSICLSISLSFHPYRSHTPHHDTPHHLTSFPAFKNERDCYEILTMMLQGRNETSVASRLKKLGLIESPSRSTGSSRGLDSTTRALQVTMSEREKVWEKSRKLVSDGSSTSLEWLITQVSRCLSYRETTEKAVKKGESSSAPFSLVPIDAFDFTHSTDDHVTSLLRSLHFMEPRPERGIIFWRIPKDL